jgi:quercetin dioxygenase-like cupin family protein
MFSTRSAICVAFVTVFLITLGSIQAAELDPKAINIQLPKDIKWVATAGGSEQAVLAGDPSKPGIYVVLTKWLPNKNSRPHSHPNDRFITVLKGTWWVNTGANYDPAGMKPVPAGSYVVHYGGQVHYDGAKDEECILEIVGMGPATSTSGERK